jgi:3-methyl-2-oxobutanoate hydroxymethyltransferase
VLVLHDMLGIAGKVHPRFVKQYANLGETIRDAVSKYCSEVRESKFPDSEHSFHATESTAPPYQVAQKK